MTSRCQLIITTKISEESKIYLLQELLIPIVNHLAITILKKIKTKVLERQLPIFFEPSALDGIPLLWLL